MPEPGRNENIDRFLATLPRGIKEAAGFTRKYEDGLLYPSIAIRHWLEIPSKTNDGRDISGSKSQWTCLCFTGSRQYAGILTAALYRHDPKSHYEVWALFPSQVSPGPHIIDHEPDLSDGYHGKKGRHTDIVEEDIREFAREYVILYYGLHWSNHQFIEILSCEPHMGHYANWACRVNFSASGDVVTLLIHPTTKGLGVFAHKYED